MQNALRDRTSQANWKLAKYGHYRDFDTVVILNSIIILSLLGRTINTMTLGGLAFAVGILVDDATVTIDNIARVLE